MTDVQPGCGQCDMTFTTQQKVLLDGLEMLYSDNLLCDVSLQVEDELVKVHRCVLAASSPYFRAMFTLDTSESSQQVVRLHNISGCVLGDLVKFFYTGHITVNESNVQALVTAASMMQIGPLKEQCEVFMSSALCVENCVDVYNFADFHNLSKLKHKAEAFILEHFTETYTKEAFLQINLQNLTKILSSDELNVMKEELVFESVLLWLKHNIDLRKKDIILLLLCVRFPLMSQGYIDTKVCHEPIIAENAICCQLACAAKNYKQGKDPESLSSKFKLNSVLRFGMFRRKMIIFSGGTIDSPNGRAFRCYDPDTKTSCHAINQIPTCDVKCKIELYKLVIAGNDDIYFLGGIFYDDYHFESNGGMARKTVLIYSSRGSCWNEVPSMKIPRCAFSVCYYCGKIYIFGGYSRYPFHPPLQNAAVFDILREIWSDIDDMPIEIAHQATAVYGSCAFLFGGLDADNQYLNTVLQYSFDMDQWTLVNTEMPRPQAEATAVTIGSSIFVLGGNNSAGNILSVCLFHPETRRWTCVKDFPEDRKFTSVVKGDNCIYVCGGVRQFISGAGATRRSKTVETKDLYTYDISNDEWVKEARFIEFGNNYTCVYATVNTKPLVTSIVD